MESLADNGNGRCDEVDTLDEAEKLFVEDLTSTQQAIAPDAKLQVGFNPDVVARYRQVGYENQAVVIRISASAQLSPVTSKDWIITSNNQSAGVKLSSCSALSCLSISAT